MSYPGMLLMIDEIQLTSYCQNLNGAIGDHACLLNKRTTMIKYIFKSLYSPFDLLF